MADTLSKRHDPVQGNEDHQSMSEGKAAGAWFLVGVIAVVFLLFFGATVATYAAMNGWIDVPFRT